MDSNIENTGLEELKVPEKMNIFQRIGCLFFSPSKLFSFIKQKPKILFPIILITIGAVVSQLLLFEPTKNVTMDVMYNTYKSMGMNYTPDQIESLVNASMYVSLAFSPVAYLLTWLVTTLITYLIFRLVKCEKGLKKYFSMTGYIMIITMVGTVISSAYIYLTGSNIASPMVTSLASLLNPEMDGTFPYALAKVAEVFSIWSFALFGIGFVYTGGVEKRKSYILTLILALVVLFASAGLSLMTVGLQNSMLGAVGGS